MKGSETPESSKTPRIGEISTVSEMTGRNGGLSHDTPIHSDTPLAGLPFSWEQFFAVSGDGVIVIATDRRIHYSNPVAEALYSHLSSSIVGLTFDDLYPAEVLIAGPNPFDYLLDRIRKEQTLIVSEFQCPYNGRWYEARVQPLTLPVEGNGRVSGLVVVRDINDRRVVQERYERAVTAARDGICEIDHVRDTVEYSARWWEMTECFDLPTDADEEARVRYWMNRIHPDDRERMMEHRRQWRYQGVAFNTITFRLGFKDDDGGLYYRWFVERGQVERDGEGKPLRSIGVLTDITTLKETETQLSAETARFERAMEAANEGLWESDLTVPTPDGEGVTYRSPVWKRIVGIPEGDPPPDDPYYRKAFLEKLHPDDVQRYTQIRYDAIFHGVPFHGAEIRLRQKDGAYRWVQIRGKTYSDPSGRPTRVTGILSDIHEKKQAELDLLAAHERFERAAAATNDGIWEHDFTRNFHFRSARWKEMANIDDSVPDDAPSLDEAEWSGFWQARIHPEDWDRLRESRGGYQGTDESADPIEFRLLNRAGEYRWVTERFQVEWDALGKVVRVVGVVADIHDRKTAELNLAARERFLAQVAHALPNILYVYDRDTNLSLYVNDRVTEMLGYQAEDLRQLGDNGVLSLIHPDDIPNYLKQTKGIDTLRDNEFIIVEMRIRHKSGDYRFIRNRIVPFARNEEGRVMQTVGVAEDVTLLKQQEEASRQASARLARAINASHDAIWELHFTSSGRMDQTYLYRSPQFWQIFGFDEPPIDKIDPRTGLWPEFDGPDLWHSRIHPDDYVALVEYRANVLLSEAGATESEYRILHNDGTYRWVLSRSRVERDENGIPVYLTGVISDIHDRKAAEQHIRESEERFRALIEAVSDTVWRRSADGALVQMVPDLTPLFPLPPGADPIFGWLERVHPQERLTVETAFRQMITEGIEYDQVYRLLRSDGVYRWRHARGIALRNPDGTIRELVGTVSDITDWVEQERSLRESEARYRTLIDSVRQGVWRATPDGKINFTNEALIELFTGERDSLVDRTRIWDEWMGLVHPKEQDRVLASWKQSVISGALFEEEFRLAPLATPDIYRRFWMRAVAVLDEQDEIREWVGVVQDVTEQREAEEAIREREERYRALTQATSDGIFRANAAGEFIWLSEALTDALQAELPEIAPLNLFVAVHPEDEARVIATWRSAILSGQPLHLHCRVRAMVAGYIIAGGRTQSNQRAGQQNDDSAVYHHWRVRAVPLYDATGAIAEWVGAVTDITEQVVQDEIIRLSEGRYRALVEASSDGVWRADAKGNIISISEAMAREYPLPESGAWGDLIHPEDLVGVSPQENEWLQKVADREPYSALYRMRRRDGVYRWRHFRAVPVFGPDQDLVEYVGTVQDVTDRVEAERALTRSENRYRLITESSFEGIFHTDAAGSLLSASPHLLAAIGYPNQLPLRARRMLSLTKYLHPAERQMVVANWRNALETGNRFEIEMQIARGDGFYYRWRVRMVPLRNNYGGIVEWVGTVSDITEQHAAEMRLRESEARLKEAQRITHSGYFRQELGKAENSGDDRNNGYTFWSDEMYRIFERSLEDGPPNEQQIIRYYTPEDFSRLQQAQERVRNNGMRHMAELPITTERGTKKWLQVHHRAERDEEGEIVAVYGAVVDITAFKAMEESLRQAQQLARRIALAVPDLLYVYDFNSAQTRYANRSIAQLLGFAPEDPELLSFPDVWSGVGGNVGRFLVSRLHPADTSVYQTALQQLREVADGEVVEVVIRLRHRDGQWRTLYCREMVFSREETTGLPREVLGVAQDITEKIEAEDLRRESEEKYRSLVDLLSDWVWESDAEGRYVYVSSQVTRRLGYRPEEMFGLPLSDFVLLEERERLSITLGGYAQRKQSFTRLPVRVVDIVGEIVYLEISGVPLFDAEGHLQGYRGVAYDVTIRRLTEDQLRSSEERMRRVIESSPDCIQILDMSGRLLSVNEAGRRLLAINDVEGVRGVFWSSFWEGEWRQMAEDAQSRAVAGETRRFSGFTRSPQGEGRWWDVVITPLPPIQGHSEQLLVVSRDISGQKLLEQQKDQLLADVMQRAERDPLTGLFDHQAFHKRLQEEGMRTQRDGTTFAVAVLDVDNFKYFNDAFGHLEGDAVLLHITNALRSTCRPTDTIGRLGGDEFAVILPGVNKQDAMRLLESRLRDNAFASRWQPRGYDAPIPLGISFGVAVYPDEAATPLASLSLADERLYRNKKEGQAGLLPHLRTELAETIVGFPMLDALVTAVDSKDRYTRKHSEDVLIYALMIGQMIGLSEADLGLLSPASLLHDVGKIGVSQRILRMPTSLTPEEYDAIKQHAPLGAGLVEVLMTNPQASIGYNEETLPLQNAVGLDSNAVDVKAIEGEHPHLLSPEQLRKMVGAVRHHHEAWDGSGYPDGLKGKEIPLMARILAVADAFSALTTDRPYRRGVDRETALEVLRNGAGKQWDPDCVFAFLEIAQNSFDRDLSPSLEAFETLTERLGSSREKPAA